MTADDRPLEATCQDRKRSVKVGSCDNHLSRSGEAEMNPSLSDRRQRSTVISRRRLLQAGGIGALTLGLPGMVAAGVDGDRGLGGGAAEKSCIFILLCGGPSHLDTWDLKPDAPGGDPRPVQARSPPTVPGMRISELHTAPGHADPAFQPDPLDDARRQHQQPFRRHAPLPERPGGCARRRSVHRLHPVQGPAQPAQRRVLRLADQVRRRSRLLRPEHRHRRPPGRDPQPAVRRLGQQPPGHARLQGSRRVARPRCRPSGCRNAAGCWTA